MAVGGFEALFNNIGQKKLFAIYSFQIKLTLLKRLKSTFISNEMELLLLSILSGAKNNFKNSDFIFWGR